MQDNSVTHWLLRLREGDPDALDRLIPLVYDELRVLARTQLRNEDAGHTLGATALVHEAYARLTDREKLSPEDRPHFFAIAARTMRRVLIDYARARKRKKRGAGRVAIPLENVADYLAGDAADEFLALDDALARLGGVSPRAAQVVEHRFFADLTLEETAESLGVSTKTVQRDWTLARAWLRKEIDLAVEDPDGLPDAHVSNPTPGEQPSDHGDAVP